MRMDRVRTLGASNVQATHIPTGLRAVVVATSRRGSGRRVCDGGTPRVLDDVSTGAVGVCAPSAGLGPAVALIRQV